MLAIIDHFRIRNGIKEDILRNWCLGRVLQLLHAEGVRNGGMFDWSNFFDPPQELMDRFDSAQDENQTEWKTLEPDFV